MAKRKKRRRTKKQQDYPGWMWMMFGLAIGLSVAFAIYMKDRNPQTDTQPVAQQSASMSADMNTEPKPPEPAAAEPAAERRFDFYDMLPNFEVVIPEDEADVRPDRKAAEVVEPGIYVLQAGSFTEYADADRRRAQLALQGIESRIQKITIDDKAYHRVRIGPLDDLDELNNIRSRLHQANIDVLRIRLGE